MVYEIEDGYLEFPYNQLPFYNNMVDYIKYYRLVEFNDFFCSSKFKGIDSFREKFRYFCSKVDKSVFDSFMGLHKNIFSEYYYRFFGLYDPTKASYAESILIYEEAIKYLRYKLNSENYADYKLVLEFFIEFFQFKRSELKGGAK
jgi:hypothetical protein